MPDHIAERGPRGWLERRYQLQPLVEFLRHKEVPMGPHSLFWYFLGGTTLFFFIVQILTGALLLMYYQPGETTSHESIRYLTTKVPFGWLVRSLHCWSAHLMVVSLVLHMFSTMMLKAYRPPRELTWVTGFFLFALTLGFGFSGYLLPWNELAFFATSVGTDLVKSVPLIGPWLLQVLRGGPEVSMNTLYRFFALHVMFLPLLFVGLISLHLLFVQRQGMAPPQGAKAAPRGMKFFPSFAIRDLLLWMACLMALVILAVFIPYGPGIPGIDWELGHKADPLAPAYPNIKPEWYFLWTYQLLKEFPPHIFGLEGPQLCLLFVTVLLVIWAIVPWLDRQSQRDKPSPGFNDFGWGAILFLSFLTLKAWDLGAGQVAAGAPWPEARVAATCAAWTLALGLLIVVVRWLVYRNRWFFCTGAALLHMLLHGFTGMSYLLSGVVAAVLATVSWAVWRSRRPRPGSLGRVGLVMVPLIGFAFTGAGAEAKSPAAGSKLATLLTAQGTNGRPVIGPELRTYFDGLNDLNRGLLNKLIENDDVTKAEHLRVLLSLNLGPQQMEVLLQNGCIICHTDAENQSPATLFSLSGQPGQGGLSMDLRDIVQDEHFRRGLSCAGCHGGDPASNQPDHPFVKEWPRKNRKQDRRWILDFCARCHSDPVLMNRYNPALPTDQLTKFKQSPHGKALVERQDMRAPQCVSCHSVHGIRRAKDPLSTVYQRRVPQTCGACHTNATTMAGVKMPNGSPLPITQLQDYRNSVHGRALLERGDTGAPACNGCHGNHAAMPVGLSSVSQSCSLCHAGNASLFDGSKHKRTFEEHGWPQCAKCHGEHSISKTSDTMLNPGEGGLCHDCHQQFARANPECSSTAEHFRQTLTTMALAQVQNQHQAELFAMKGLDVDPIQNQLNDLTDHLKKSRSHIHSFNRNTFDQAAAPGLESVHSIAGLLEAARHEYRFRQVGLAASLGLMALVMLALYWKLRSLESAEKRSSEQSRKH